MLLYRKYYQNGDLMVNMIIILVKNGHIKRLTDQ